MAMLKIIKGDRHLLIPAGAYERQYAPVGWELEGKGAASGMVTSKAEKNTSTEPITPKPAKEVADEWDAAEEEVEQEKTVDEMSFKELQAKAKELKIDVRNLKTVGDYKAAVRDAIK